MPIITVLVRKKAKKIYFFSNGVCRQKIDCANSFNCFLGERVTLVGGMGHGCVCVCVWRLRTREC